MGGWVDEREEVLCAFIHPPHITQHSARRGLYAGKDVLFGNMVSHSNRK